MSIVYLNGNYLPMEQATVSVMDRGFLFGDGIYEVIPVYHGKIFHLDAHFRRLQNSLAAIQMQPPLSQEALLTLCNRLLADNKHLGSEQVIYLQITRGADSDRHHDIPTNIPPTVFVKTSKRPDYPFDELAKGKHAITLTDTRWQNCYIKAISLLPNILLNQQAKDAGACDAILLRDGFVTEGASSNVFIVRDNVLITPPLSKHILGGITRDVVINISKAIGIRVAEKMISEAELMAADEVWITSSTREIFPIVTLNDTTIGVGKPGSVWLDVYHALQTSIKQLHDS